MSETIEVRVAGDLVTIRYRDHDAIIIAADAEGHRLNVALDTDALEWLDTVEAKDPLTLSVHRIPQAPPIAEPAAPAPPAAQLHLVEEERPPPRTRVPTTKVRPARRVVVSEEHLDIDERDEILHQVLDSLRANPRQTKEETAEESHRIAKDVLGDDDHHSVMQVAGVRAALARGVYDHLDEVGDIRG